jgi:hypothetical protein
MGTMVGDDGSGNQIGVAPAAQWIAAKGCADSGCASDHLLAAAEWVLAPYTIGGTPENGDPAQRPHIVNNSWGSSGGRLYYQAAVEAWRAADIFPAFAAGNDGPNTGTVGSPGDYAESFASGAIDSNDVIADFSSRGPSSLTNEMKPNVSAPGVNIRSATNDGGYGSFNGTSMASPHVAGCAALIRSAAPDISSDAIEDVLINTAVDLGASGPDYDYGHGRIDCYAAVEQARGGTDWLSVSPTSGALAAGGNQDITVTINTNGLAPGSYTGQIFINSNDPDEATVQIPVNLLVTGINTDPFPTLPEPAEVSEGTITPDAGGTVSSGEIWAIFPEGAVAITTTATYRQITAPTVPLDDEFTFLRSFTLEASTIAGDAVTDFAQSFEIIFRYAEGENPSGLTFVVLNEESDQWELVPTSMDTNNKRVIGVLDRVGEFALFTGDITDVPTIYLPLIKR